MRKMIRVALSTPTNVLFGEARRGEVSFLNSRTVETNPFETARFQGEFFLADENEVDRIVAALAETHPGKEVQIYSLEGVAVCPPAPMIRKDVSKDGILPL